MPNVWPSSLPAPQLRNYEERSPNNLVRTEMDVGPAKARRRTTAAVRPHKMLFHMTLEQVAIFDEFLAEVLFDGVLPFEFTHPRTGVTGNFRIIPPVTYTVDVKESVWWVQVDMEELAA